MATAEFKVSDRGRMALPAEVRRRWNLEKGGTVEVADLGGALLIVRAGGGVMRAVLRTAIEDAGGYAKLAKATAADEPDLG